ncbi:DUF6232 family protein [Novosphingobium lindaniclasticum]
MQITVDKDFARFDDKSYAINKINTVEVRAVKPYGTNGAWACTVLSLLFAYGAFNLLSEGKNAILSILLCIGFTGLAYWLWQRSRTIVFQLFLMTSSSSQQAYSSLDGQEIQVLREKIESAMAAA